VLSDEETQELGIGEKVVVGVEAGGISRRAAGVFVHSFIVVKISNRNECLFHQKSNMRTAAGEMAIYGCNVLYSFWNEYVRMQDRIVKFAETSGQGRARRSISSIQLLMCHITMFRGDG
jgi:hypothetical protein